MDRAFLHLRIIVVYSLKGVTSESFFSASLVDDRDNLHSWEFAKIVKNMLEQDTCVQTDIF